MLASRPIVTNCDKPSREWTFAATWRAAVQVATGAGEFDSLMNIWAGSGEAVAARTQSMRRAAAPIHNDGAMETSTPPPPSGRPMP
jgi:hypothetical protein